MAAPLFRAAFQAYQASGSSMTVPLPHEQLVAGDYILILYTASPTAAASALVTPPAGWAAVYTHATIGSGSSSVWGAFYVPGMDDPTWVMASANPPRSVAGAAWSGVDATTPINVLASQQRAVNSMDSVAPPVLTGVAECTLALLFMAKDTLSTAVADPPGTIRRAMQLGTASSASHALVCEAPAPTAGTTPSFAAMFNAPATLNGIGYTIALTPGAPPVPEPTVTTTWVGAVTDSSAVVSVRALNAVSVELVVNGGTFAAVPDFDGIAKFSVFGLAPLTEYSFQVVVAGVTLGTGRIKTFPTSGTPTSFTIAAGSCQDTGSDPAVYDLIAAKAPDLMWHAGDKDYYDQTTNNRPEMLNSYTSWSGRPKLRSVTSTVPTLYVVDQHDGGGPNSNKNTPVWPALKSVYRQVVPHWPLPSTNGALYQSLVYGRLRVITLDTRSQRDPITDPESATKSMLGAEQKAWLAAELRQPEPVKIILCGIMWRDTGGADGDRWGSFTTEFAEICDDIAANQSEIGHVYVISGDRHAIAADDGSNSGGGVPNAVCAPLYQVTTGATETWSHGYFREIGYQSYFGWFDITDSGDTITIDYTGRDAADVVHVQMTTEFAIEEAPVPLPPLATVADYERLLNIAPLTGADALQVADLLEASSSIIREAAGVAITRTTSAVVLAGTDSARLRLPMQPIVSIGSVSIDGQPITDYTHIGDALYRRCGWNPCGTPTPVGVVFTHGLLIVPKWIVGLAVSLAAAARVMSESEQLGAPAGVQSERIDDYSRTYETGGGAKNYVIDLPEATARRLRRMFGGGAYSVAML